MKTGFGNYKQFLEFFVKAPRNVQNILYKAYPEYAARMTNEYMNNIKKVVDTASKVKDKVANEVKSITAKPKATSIPNKDLDSAFDTLYNKGKEATSQATKATKAASKFKIPNALKGVGSFTTKRIAPIQGAMNLFGADSDAMDRLAGLGMIGTGLATAAGATATAPWAGALLLGDVLKKHAAAPTGDAIGTIIANHKYGDPKDYFNPEVGLLDTTTDLKGRPFTNAEREKILAHNDRILAEQALKYGQAITPYGTTSEPQQTTEQSGSIPTNYGNTTYTNPQSQSNIGFIPQNAQNAIQGGLNNYQDILQGNNISPSLSSIVEPVNYSNEYLMKANDISNKLQGVQGEQMNNNNINPYAQLRGYTDVNNQLAPVPNQPQNIREDVLPEYLQVMEGIRGKQGDLNYADILNQYNAAMEADRKQNQLNQMVNAFGGFGQSGKIAPIYYVSAKGDLNALQQDQPAETTMLPTTSTTNADKFLGQLKIQQAQQANALAQQKAYQDILKAQQEREDMYAQASALAEQFGGRPEMYMNKDIVQSLLSQTINPNIQAQANVMEAIGKAPTQDQLKAAEQYRTIAGNLDQTNLQKQFDAQIAQINNQAKLVQTQLEQNGMDKRMAAQLANQAALNQYTQLMLNTRAMMEDQRARDLAVYGRGTQENVANIYANARGTTGKQPATQEDLYNQLIIEGAKSGVPIPQLIKYADLLGTNRGLTSAEDAELNR